MFQTVPLYIIRSFSQYTQQLYKSYKRAGSGRKVLTLESTERRSQMLRLCGVGE